MQSDNDTVEVTTTQPDQKPVADNELTKMAPRWAAMIGILATGVL